jgi:hypothetical protein
MPSREPVSYEINDAPTILPRSWVWCFWRHARKWVIAVIGGTLLSIGGVLFLIPGPPGWPLILMGLALLATEFAWARWMLATAQQRLQRMSRAAPADGQAEALALAEASPPASPAGDRAC